jgi:hypothetical protein
MREDSAIFPGWTQTCSGMLEAQSKRVLLIVARSALGLRTANTGCPGGTVQGKGLGSRSRIKKVARITADAVW